MAEELRYCGTEIELSVDTQSTYPADEFVMLMFRAHRAANLFLPTTKKYSGGGRWYVDIGYHPEYSTAEHTSAIGATQQEVQGEEFSSQEFTGTLDYLEKQGIGLRARAKLRRTTLEITKKGSQQSRHLTPEVRQTLSQSDSSLPSWTVGHHENYMIERNALSELSPDSPASQSIAVHLITRQIFTGGGGFLGDTYYVSPRSQFIHEEFSSQTVKNRPIINTRDEPLTSDTYRRLHVITGDDNISPWALSMKLGTTKLVCKAVEAGILWGDLYPEWPVRTMKAIGRDASVSTNYSTCTGSRFTATEAQAEIIRRIKNANLDLNDEELYLLDEWEAIIKALSLLKSHPKDQRLNGIDWIVRGRIIERAPQKGLDPYQVDNDYSRIINSDGKIGMGRALRNKGYFPKSEVIMDDPRPLPLRPRLRGIINAANQLAPYSNLTASWDFYRIKDYERLFPDFPTTEQAEFITNLVKSALEEALRDVI